MISLVVGSKEGRSKLKGSDLTRLRLREEKKKRVRIRRWDQPSQLSIEREYSQNNAKRLFVLITLYNRR